MNRGRRSALLALALALTLTACSGGPDQPPPSEHEFPSAMPSADTTGHPAEPGETPACDTIIPTSLAAEFTGFGMTALEEEFRIGEHVIEGGIQCTWGDHDIATDHVQIYGWAPIEPAHAAEMQEYLEAQQWRREEGQGFVYLTENSDFATTVDDDGYGMTYAFGDGFVLLADTKQGLALVTWRG
ncbi:hypothetical protein [Microbacterium album]|uniref:Uncharacterized protein n=1 Tax=Microbacterium album TaxID=2053191 RepID=A0A917IC86_9MICO|nr:hypothetical protein [Microbacterium album]GGH33911.1 hypothetical protein GCM10010921_01200 [Microbacterium album]